MFKAQDLKLSIRKGAVELQYLHGMKALDKLKTMFNSQFIVLDTNVCRVNKTDQLKYRVEYKLADLGITGFSDDVTLAVSIRQKSRIVFANSIRIKG